MNIAVAIYTIEQLQLLGVFISQESIQSGISLMTQQGRMRILDTSPLVLVDGAHNPDGIIQFRETIESLFPGKKILLIFGVLKDKDINGMFRQLHTICQSVIITKPDSPRAANLKDVEKIVENFLSKEKIQLCQTVSDAINETLHHANEDSIIIIVGSLYLINDVMKFFSSSLS